MIIKLKRVLSCICVCLFIAGFGTTVFAAETNLPDGFCIDDENGVSVDGDGEYFMYVDDIEPGDVITRNLIVRNLEQSGKYLLSMMVEPLETTGPINWLDNLLLKISVDGRMVYEGRLRGDGLGTYTFAGDGHDMINDAIDLGSYQKGQQGVVRFELTADADHFGYWSLSEKSTADIRWKFLAAHEGGEGPITGDYVRIGLYILLFLILIATILVFISYRKLRGDYPTG